MRMKDPLARDRAIDAYLRKQKGAPGATARMLVALIREIVPGLDEKLRHGAPQFAVGGEVFCYVAAHAAYTNLGFMHGSKMKDPTGRIEGTGKSLRHIKVRGVDDLSRDELAPLIMQAAVLGLHAAQTSTPKPARKKK